ASCWAVPCRRTSASISLRSLSLKVSRSGLGPRMDCFLLLVGDLIILQTYFSRNVLVLMIEGKCSCFRAKPAYISGHLPLRAWVVNGVKVRRNQPQGSKIGLKVRTRQNLGGSYRSRSGISQGTNGNLECI